MFFFSLRLDVFCLAYSPPHTALALLWACGTTCDDRRRDGRILAIGAMRSKSALALDFQNDANRRRKSSAFVRETERVARPPPSVFIILIVCYRRGVHRLEATIILGKVDDIDALAKWNINPIFSLYLVFTISSCLLF